MSGLLETLKRHRYYALVEQVNRLEATMQSLPDQAFADRVVELRRRRRKGEELPRLMPEMYALVREVSRRTIGIRQYDMQVAAAVGLAEGRVIEMETGEGKTFVAPLAASLYALDQRGVHVLTANDYLAGRDAGMLKAVYNMLGLTVDTVLADSPRAKRAAAYQADVTYTTVVQLGFDFLRQYFEQDPDAIRQRDIWQYLRSEIDGSSREKRCLRGRHFAILDEVDSILIDYARAPLSISVEADTQRPAELYTLARQFALSALQEREDFTLDRVRQRVELTDKGKRRTRELQDEYGYLHLLDAEWEERLTEALTAQHLFEKGEDYVVQDQQIMLVDQTSGRLMIGQRLGGELHQALEVKEGVPVRPRQTVAKKITIQALVRPYESLAGMTGTAWEPRREFATVYGMKIVRFAPRLPLRRQQKPDVFFLRDEARWAAVAADIGQQRAAGRPVLVGTRSVEKSQRLSQMLTDRGIPHHVLNAVDHAKEAEIIAEAGQRGVVTVAANMAGRGVEIKLGDEVEELGGMHVIGTERHTLTRIDRQLAGRCGRRGQPGSVQFYASLEDDVLDILPEHRRARLKRKHTRRDAAPFHSPALKRLFDRAQAMFATRFAQVRHMLLVKDLAEEEADRILFGQENL
jgi:preprotein translocase subunit SecA